MNRSTSDRRRRLTLIGLVATCASAALATVGAAGAATPAYALSLTALTGPLGTDLTLDVETALGGAAVDVLKKVQLKIFAADGSLEDVRNYTDISTDDAIDLGEVARGRRVEADVLIQTNPEARTHFLQGETVTRLRPDLVVAAVHAPQQTTTSRPVDVVAEIAELNGDTGVTASVTLAGGAEPLVRPVSVPAGGRVSVTFEDVEITSPLLTELSLEVSEARPGETDVTNNARHATIDVTEHELVTSNVLVPSLGGYGAQFNQHVYAAITPAPPETLPDLEAKVVALEPQLVRIFFHEVQERDPGQMASFVKTVELAHRAGAAINITYHTAANAKLQPDAYMGQFASILDDLVRVRGYTNIRWITIQNEVNTTTITPAQYEALYRALHVHLVNRGLRQQIGLMAGDLVRDNQRVWFREIATRLNDIVDAYSVHIYWNYWDTQFMETRLRDVRKIVTEELPPDTRKPTYVTEFGVRGILNFPGKTAVQSGYWQDGTEMVRTNIGAFQQLWFDVAAAQLGFAGTVKWDAYWGKYSATYREMYYAIGPADEGWPLLPTYHALRLLLQTTARGWQVVQVAPWSDDDWVVGQADAREQEITAYTGLDGELTLIGLETNGAPLNAVSTQTPQYSVGSLPPNTNFNLVLWNETGNGENTIRGTVPTNAAGVARFEVPLHAAFALTTVPVS